MCISWGRSWQHLVLNRASWRASCASAGPFLAIPGSQPRIMASNMCISWAVPGNTWFSTPRIMAGIMCISWAVPGNTWFLTAHHGEHHVHQLGRSWQHLVLNRASWRASCASAGPFLATPGSQPHIMASIVRISWAVPGNTWFSTAHHGGHHVHQLGRSWQHLVLNRTSWRASCASAGPFLAKRASWRASCASAGPFLATPGSQPHIMASIVRISWAVPGKTRIMASIMCISWAVPGNTWFSTAHHGEHRAHQLGRSWQNAHHGEHHAHQLGLPPSGKTWFSKPYSRYEGPCIIRPETCWCPSTPKAQESPKSQNTEPLSSELGMGEWGYWVRV